MINLSICFCGFFYEDVGDFIFILFLIVNFYFLFFLKNFYFIFNFFITIFMLLLFFTFSVGIE